MKPVQSTEQRVQSEELPMTRPGKKPPQHPVNRALLGPPRRPAKDTLISELTPTQPR